MRISRLTTLPLSVPLAPPPGGSDHPLRAQFVTYCLVRVETDDGLVGYGEISDGWGCEYAQVAAAIVDEALSRFVLGADPGAPGPLVQRIWGWLRRRQGTAWLVAQAVSGLEIALWDLAGKAVGQPVHRLLGALPHRIGIYASGNFLSQGPAEVHLDSFRPYLERGVRAVKLRIGPTWERDLETLTAFRQLVGPAVTIYVDGNEAFSAKTALRIARRLEALGVGFFEEPVPRDNPRALAWLVAESPIPIAYGEHVHRLDGFLELAERGLADVWQPDATVCGGILEARKVLDLAAARNVRISPHAATTPLGVAANLHVAATASTLGLFEYSPAVDALAPWFAGGAALALGAVSDGCLSPPDGPGLGIEPQPELFERYPYQRPGPLLKSPPLYQGTV